MAHLLDDIFLRPFEGAIRGRAKRAEDRIRELTGGKQSLGDWANAHNYFGLRREKRGWVFREWAPKATSMWLIGDFNGWKIDPKFECFRIPNSDVWEVKLPAKAIKAGQKYHLEVRWEGGHGERIPTYARYVVQNDETKLFEAEVYESKYVWKNESKSKSGVEGKKLTPLIYEAHVGMGTEEEKVGSYAEFRDNVLPRIKKAGYNVVQLMAIAEHPYYGSFGYHVSSFFAASSRFGTPDDLKSLIDTAHGMGLKVIMDLVHSHAVANERDGLSLFDGTDYIYFHSGDKGRHSAWGSRCFDYGKNETCCFLLSNLKFWMEEYHLDGFRFDGVTSMIYWDHGLGTDFGNYELYFNSNVDESALSYLALANVLVHELNPDAITIAEDVSGLAGLAAPFEAGGIGFDFRMSMGVADHWIKWIKERDDWDWNMGEIWWELTRKRSDEKTISYAECHDQAMVGDKTIIFRLLDALMYDGMSRSSQNILIDRGIALHKMIRLLTLVTAGDGYLNFMGNEFGHPEWIDFPREGNGWSFKYARRQWQLVDNPDLRYAGLNAWDAAMINLAGAEGFLSEKPSELCANEGDKVLVVCRKNCIFAFNFNPSESFVDYGFEAPSGNYAVVLDSDRKEFGGFSRVDDEVEHLVVDGRLKLYLPSRCVVVLKKIEK